MTADRRALLVAALGFARLKVEPRPPAVATLRTWLDSWTGLGAIVTGMARQGFDFTLTRHGNGETPWRSLFYPSRFLHVSTSGSAWGETPWRAVQEAAWAALTKRDRS